MKSDRRIKLLSVPKHRDDGSRTTQLPRLNPLVRLLLRGSEAAFASFLTVVPACVTWSGHPLGSDVTTSKPMSKNRAEPHPPRYHWPCKAQSSKLKAQSPDRVGQCTPTGNRSCAHWKGGFLYFSMGDSLGWTVISPLMQCFSFKCTLDCYESRVVATSWSPR